MTTSPCRSDRPKRRRPAKGVSDDWKPVGPNSGARNGKARISTTEVLEIRKLRGQMLVREIAARYGLSASQVSKIQLRRQWVHL